MPSRFGRHTAAASTWVLRSGYTISRLDAVALVQKGRVLLDGKLAETGYAYYRPSKLTIKSITDKPDVVLDIPSASQRKNR